MFYLGKCDILGKKEGENTPFETLKKSHLKRNILIGVLVVGIISAIILQFTRAKYRVTESIPLVNGTINYTLPDLNIIGLYVDGEEVTELDSSKEYTLDTSKSTCTYKDGSVISNLSINYDSDTKELQITPFTTKGTKCYLYFDEDSSVAETLLANYPTQLTRSSFTSTVTNTTTGTIYYADTSKGRTYYFAGNPTDNWVYFGDFYWRIIRINEDGTIRIIYQGTSANTTGTGTQLQESTFSINKSTYNNNAYVGYMYTLNEVHGLGTDSGIKKVLDNWYRDNLATNYGDKIDGNVGFCGDREPSISSSTSNGSGGTGKTVTYYGAYIRLVNSSKNPTFECTNDSDLYTTSGSEDGNKALTYPIGLITADEVAYAGGVNGSNNQSYYLYTDQYYWTMSPYRFYGSNARMFRVTEIGYLDYDIVDDSIGVRPVINLKANVQITGGNGSSSSPYVISQS